VEPSAQLRVSEQNASHARSPQMPIILWLLGVPLTLVIVLMLTGVV
jgi:hypothetical protein